MPALKRASAFDAQPGDFSPVVSPSGMPNPAPVAPPLSQVEKPALKKRPANAVAQTNEMQRVRISFPPMPAPFGGPRKYDENHATATLTLSFRDEHKAPDQHKALRETLTMAEKALNYLIPVIDPKFKNQVAIVGANANTLIRTGKTRPEEDGGGQWPDNIPLKLYPEDVIYKSVDGTTLDKATVAEISFFDYNVEPTVELRDVWKVHGTYYPRLVVTRCVLHPRDIPAPITLPVPVVPQEEEEEEEKEWVDEYGNVLGM